MAETAGSKMIEAMAELQGIVTGATPAARIHINGFSYVPEDQWQDIATAPTGGEYLVYQPVSKTGRMTLGARICLMSQAGHIRETTHWMPLPAPPK